ncbi:metallophosphoesterase [Microbacterium sp. P04]|uniref:metallophosphoesterase n=1 Tax=Microbacterium sp. P04 TaxID=3366947 RepID=UPI00374769F1
MASPTPPSTHRRLRRATAAVATAGLAGTLLAAGIVPAATAAPAEGDLASRFTLAVLPDTQFYSRYSDDQFTPRYGTDPFSVQTEWLADNADELHIPFVAHLGDIVDRVGQEKEWKAADAAMQNLEDDALPYSILAGNHDVRDSNDDLDDTGYDLTKEPFLQWFGKDRAAKQSTYQGSDPTGFSQYHIFEAEGQQFMVLALPWRASDQTIAWADQVMAEHPTVPVILTTHELLNIEADQSSPRETGYGLELWDKLIKSNDQIFLTFNGHFHGATRLPKTNDFGHEVTEVLMDYQMAYEGGNGYLGLLEFDLTNNQMALQTASPWVTFKPRESLTKFDQPLLEGPQQQYSVDIDFAERFAGFNTTFGPGTADEPSLTTAARNILLDGFEGPDPDSTELPGNELDFPEVDGTLAHWRFNGLDGVVGADTVIEDVAGDNDLTRADPAKTNAVGAQWSDVTVESADVHGFSSDGAAACFDNSSGSRYSYLTTAPDAAINNADLTNGYTIETFVKMDEDWDASANGWSKFLTRTGNRSLMGAPETEWDWTASPTALGISNLREFQFTSLPADVEQGDQTNWSGEIMVESWAHVAVVNDPATKTTTMYVDGAPVLRNVTDTVGMAGAADMPWILGSDWVDDAARNGWAGCIGETRIIDHATTPDEWLTSRADLTGFEITAAPQGELTSAVTSVRFAGEGFPGAQVTLAPAAPEGTMAVAADLGGASTVVGADGRWEIRVTDGLTAGQHEVALAQALGSRSSDPQTVTFAIAAAPQPSASPSGSPSASDPANTGRPTGGAGGTPTGSGLAATGADGTMFGLSAGLGALLLITGAATVIIRHRRKTAVTER